ARLPHAHACSPRAVGGVPRLRRVRRRGYEGDRGVRRVSDDRARLAAALPAYEIGRELGRGGFGVVVEGRHRQLGRDVAIKQLPRSFASDPEVQRRFLAEARILATLDHPHVVPIYDYVEAGGVRLLVMEKLPGGPLRYRFSTD